MSDKLKPCPFCSNKKHFNFTTYQTTKWGQVECAECGAQGPEVRTGYHDTTLCRPINEVKNMLPWHDEAIDAWNRRAGDADKDTAD